MEWILLTIFIVLLIAFLFIQEWNKRRLSTDDLARFKKAKLGNWWLLIIIVWGIVGLILTFCLNII
jgi:hypothetical protein